MIVSGCSGSHTDYNYTTDYYYKNDCSQAVTLYSYSPNYDYINDVWKEGKDSIFTIAPGAEILIRYIDESHKDPLNWGNFTNRQRDSTIVSKSNGISRFIHYYKNNDELYNSHTGTRYKLIQRKSHYIVYRYTFTDEDFE